MKHTSLYERHVRDASTVINLKGFARAMHYRGHMAEHLATRQGVTLCDVSHMGEFDFRGPDAVKLVQKIITNDAGKLAVNQVLYSAMCDEKGDVIDDLLCYRLAADHFIWVVNVTKTDSDFQWVLKHANGMDVEIRNISTDTALLALQGPSSRETLQRIAKVDLSTLKYYWIARTTLHTRHAEVPCMVSRTGYTGEHGYEIMVARDLAPLVWDELLSVGQPLGIMEHGVAARESLRTEAGYLLNGNDMDGKTNPFEAGIGWAVKLNKDFIGSDALRRVQNGPLRRQIVGLEAMGDITIRKGYRIFRDGQDIGETTSGPISRPIAGRNLGLGYVMPDCAAVGTELEFEIRGKRHKGRVVAMPLCQRRCKDEPVILTSSPYDLRFSPAHVWARMEDAKNGIVSIGLTDFGQRDIGDVLCLELPMVGDKVAKGRAAGWGDSYRRAFDVEMPVSGEVVAVNADAVHEPGQINKYPYIRGGLIKVKVASSKEYDELMSFEAYAALVRQAREYDLWSQDLRMT
jgi:aminomethyltransferase